MRRAELALALLIASTPSIAVSLREVAAGRSLPLDGRVVREIRFEGNRTTQPRTMLRELPFTAGEKVRRGDLERGRQAIQDLGLFKKVEMREDTRVDGSVDVTYVVKERWYLLPYPRVDANSDGEYAYGGQLAWNNLFGLNHTLRATVLQRETKRAGTGKETQFSAGYAAPQLFDSRWSLGVGAAYTQRPVSDELGAYEETLMSAQVLALRSLSDGPPSQGWSAGAGLSLLSQHTDNGIGEYGETLSPTGTIGYRDVRFNIYSESGMAFQARLEAAAEGVASDYSTAKLNISGIEYLPVGHTPHQTVHLIGETGLAWNAPPNLRNFTLGGSGSLRGYKRSFTEGNAYYRVATEWARPVWRPWLRTVVIAEAGNVFAQPNDIDVFDVKASLGLGVRLRISTFVNFEVEAGVAVPVDGGEVRFFAGRV